MTEAAADVTTSRQVTEQERQDISALTSAAVAADGAEPLDDQVRLDLEFGAGSSAHHLCARVPGSATVIGYAHVTLGSGEDAASAHIVVDPEHRRRGVGRTLVGQLAELSRPSPLRVWAHGDGADAQAFAANLEMSRVRDLWKMRRTFDRPVPLPTYPPDIAIRPFHPGRDDEAWVEVNAAAFRNHPEQGGLTLEDLHQRMAQPWFDPNGFFVADRHGDLVGFHWTKVHQGEESGLPDSVGEVYAVGVHPQMQGLGLGTSLTLTGLRHLLEVGLPAVILYVDASNTAAVAVYQRLGFAVVHVDAMYEHH
ncbi:MAG: mycothiol synthase [Nocardioidaceae bacterium]